MAEELKDYVCFNIESKFAFCIRNTLSALEKELTPDQFVLARKAIMDNSNDCKRAIIKSFEKLDVSLSSNYNYQ